MITNRPMKEAKPFVTYMKDVVMTLTTHGGEALHT